MFQSLAKVSMHSDPTPSTRVATLLGDIFHKGKKKPWALLVAYLNHLIGSVKFLFLNLIITIFDLGYVTPS